jgi:hypothetical protein
LVSVPIRAPVDATKTFSVADELVLVASTKSSCFDASYSTREIVTASLGDAAGETVKMADLVAPPYDAEMVAVELAVTLFEVTVNAALVAPAGTVTGVGTVATAVLLLATVTVAPPNGAAELSVIVAVDELPPETEAALSTSEATDGPVANGLTVSTADLVTPAPDAVIVTVVGADGSEVVMKKPPPPANRGTVTYGGTLATAGLLLDRRIWTS